VMKKRFAVLRTPLEIGSFDDMWLTYYTCVALHNFIREEKGNSMVDKEFEAEVDREIRNPLAAVSEALYPSDNEDAAHCMWRDDLAQNMWDDYQEYIHHNNV
jgi:hypothetical protein